MRCAPADALWRVKSPLPLLCAALVKARHELSRGRTRERAILELQRITDSLQRATPKSPTGSIRIALSHEAAQAALGEVALDGQLPLALGSKRVDLETGLAPNCDKAHAWNENDCSWQL